MAGEAADEEEFEKGKKLYGLQEWQEKTFLFGQFYAYIQYKVEIDAFYENQVEQIGDLDIGDIL